MPDPSPTCPTSPRPTPVASGASERGGILIRLAIFVLAASILVTGGLGALARHGRGDFSLLIPTPIEATTTEPPAAVPAPPTVPVTDSASAPSTTTPTNDSGNPGPTSPPEAAPPPAPEPAPDPAPSPTSPPAPAPDSAPAAAPAGLKDGLLSATNADRAAQGLATLSWHDGLAAAAQTWAEHMAATGSLVHQDLGALWGVDASLTSLAENILTGPGTMTAAEMETAWMSSPGHRANILRSGLTVAGIGVAYGADGRVWVSVVFGG